MKNKALTDQYWCDQRADGLDFFQESLSDFDVHELTAYKKMLSELLDMLRMKLTHRMKQPKCVEDNRIILERTNSK